MDIAKIIATHLLNSNVGTSADCIRFAAMVQVFTDKHIDALVAAIQDGGDAGQLMDEFFSAFRVFALAN